MNELIDLYVQADRLAGKLAGDGDKDGAALVYMLRMKVFELNKRLRKGRDALDPGMPV